MHVLVDAGLLHSRAAELNVGHDHAALFALLSTTFAQHLPLTLLHASESDFSDILTDLVQSHVWDDGVVSSQTAMTNHDGVSSVNVEVNFAMSDLPGEGATLEIPVEGYVAMYQHPDRPYVGHHVDVKVVVKTEQLGRVILGPAEINVLDAKLDFRLGGCQYSISPK